MGLQVGAWSDPTQMRAERSSPQAVDNDNDGKRKDAAKISSHTTSPPPALPRRPLDHRIASHTPNHARRRLAVNRAVPAPHSHTPRVGTCAVNRAAPSSIGAGATERQTRFEKAAPFAFPSSCLGNSLFPLFATSPPPQSPAALSTTVSCRTRLLAHHAHHQGVDEKATVATAHRAPTMTAHRAPTATAVSPTTTRPRRRPYHARTATAHRMPSKTVRNARTATAVPRAHNDGPPATADSPRPPFHTRQSETPFGVLFCSSATRAYDDGRLTPPPFHTPLDETPHGVSSSTPHRTRRRTASRSLLSTAVPHRVPTPNASPSTPRKTRRMRRLVLLLGTAV
ncbi:hypothetical protein PLICRDRAFT_177071 [Plicaturopsis crispa FD-325 SS-3]|nr:hypothetical protein PLICRDRAFT_177071 [Plicaturopsis crispa FD-325 SS-3]